MSGEGDEEAGCSGINDNNGGVDNERKRSLRQSSLKSTQRLKDDFLGDFDPEKSKREKRKIKRHISSSKSSKTVYDEKGRFRETQLNICDCMVQSCIGCFFPCTNCGECKCGPNCRVNRKFTYESINFDGNNDIVTNPFYVPPKK